MSQISGLLDKIDTFVAVGFLSAIGAVAQMVYGIVSKKQPIKPLIFFCSIILGFFAGNVVGSFVPAEYEYRDGLLLVTGFVAYPLLEILDQKAASFISKKVFKE